MRIIVNGQQAFGKIVFEALMERGEDVVGVFCTAAKPGARPDPLKEAALAHGVALFEPTSFKDDAVAETLRSLEPDLGVMAFVTLIVPKTFLDIPRLGSIQYHPSLLPRHRGPSSINWPIIQGETRTGLSIFWPDEGLDTGPILLQKDVEISATDTLGSVYFEKMFPLGVEAMVESVDLVKAGKAPRIAQDESQATYESWCTRDDVEIDWQRPADEVYNLIRGANPQPGAWTSFDGTTFQIFDAAKTSTMTDHADAQPGRIIDVIEDGFVVGAGGGAIEVKRVRPQGGDKITATEFLGAGGPGKGTQLGQ
jgi:methionyl-tRNA formyltransferase